MTFKYMAKKTNTSQGLWVGLVGLGVGVAVYSFMKQEKRSDPANEVVGEMGITGMFGEPRD